MRILITNYIYDPLNQKVILKPNKDDLDPFIRQIESSELLMITNVTRNEIIYLPQKTGYGGTLSDNVVILEKDVSSHDKNDDLQIIMFTNDSAADKNLRKYNTTVICLLNSILATLQKIELHMSQGSEIEVEPDDIFGC